MCCKNYRRTTLMRDTMLKNSGSKAKIKSEYLWATVGFHAKEKPKRCNISIFVTSRESQTEQLCVYTCRETLWHETERELLFGWGSPEWQGRILEFFRTCIRAVRQWWDVLWVKQSSRWSFRAKQQVEMKKLEDVRFFGSTVQNVKRCVQAGWSGWWKVSDVTNVSPKIKRNVYKIVVRAAILLVEVQWIWEKDGFRGGDDRAEDG